MTASLFFSLYFLKRVIKCLRASMCTRYAHTSALLILERETAPHPANCLSSRFVVIAQDDDEDD